MYSITHFIHVGIECWGLGLPSHCTLYLHTYTHVQCIMYIYKCIIMSQVLCCSSCTCSVYVCKHVFWLYRNCQTGDSIHKPHAHACEDVMMRTYLWSHVWGFYTTNQNKKCLTSPHTAWHRLSLHMTLYTYTPRHIHKPRCGFLRRRVTRQPQKHTNTQNNYHQSRGNVHCICTNVYMNSKCLS